MTAFVIGIIIMGILAQGLLAFLKFKIFRKVYDGSPKKYMEAKILEREFQVNRAKGLKEEK